MDSVPQLPTAFYVVVGVMVVFNLGTIFAIIVTMLKLSYWLGTKLTSIEKMASDADKQAVSAHQRLNTLTGERANARSR